MRNGPLSLTVIFTGMRLSPLQGMYLCAITTEIDAERMAAEYAYPVLTANLSGAPL